VNTQIKVIEKIEFLANEPRPAGVVKLSATDSLYRVRTGDYRIIYQIQDGLLLITITKVGHRRDIYK
jgi:mRNA interferase RelE/StbE